MAITLSPKHQMTMNTKKSNSFFCILGLFAFYMILSLSCASSPTPEKKYKITIEHVNDWLKNSEQKIPAGNGLSSKQLMEVTKLCILSGELQDVIIVGENEVLSFAYLETKVIINEIAVNVKYSYSISKQGIVTTRIQSISEVDNGAFVVSIKETNFEEYKQSVIKIINSKITNSANIVINRAQDFA